MEPTSTTKHCGNGRTRLSKVFCGIDWAENHHDIALVDQDGTQLAKLRVSDDSAGFNASAAGVSTSGAPVRFSMDTSAPRGGSAMVRGRGRY
jgi:hypothetical protein